MKGRGRLFAKREKKRPAKRKKFTKKVGKKNYPKREKSRSDCLKSEKKCDIISKNQKSKYKVKYDVRSIATISG